jgi:hypothetical protein
LRRFQHDAFSHGPVDERSRPRGLRRNGSSAIARARDIGQSTLILTGWKVSGSVAYTSVGATLHDYTVVVPVDTAAAPTDYETVIGYFQILNHCCPNVC